MQVDRRTKILAIAESHFAAGGYAGASLSAIAREAGVRNSGLIHHFESKDALYRAVLDCIAESVEIQFGTDEPGATAEPTPLERFLRGHAEWISANPARFVIVQRELLDSHERLDRAHHFPLQRYLQRLVALIDDAKAENEIRQDLSTLDVITTILGTMSYAVSVTPVYRLALDMAPDAVCDWTTALPSLLLKLLAPPNRHPS